MARAAPDDLAFGSGRRSSFCFLTWLLLWCTRRGDAFFLPGHVRRLVGTYVRTYICTYVTDTVFVVLLVFEFRALTIPHLLVSVLEPVRFALLPRLIQDHSPTPRPGREKELDSL